LVGSTKQLEVIGLECPILQIKSPMTYISKTPIVAFCAKLDVIMKEYEQMNPYLMQDLIALMNNKLQIRYLISSNIEKLQANSKTRTVDLRHQLNQR